MTRPPISRIDQGMAEMPDATPDADGWITWAGGKCPVPGNAGAQVEFRSGKKFTGKAASYYWLHDGDRIDIVAYRLVTPAPAPAPDPRDLPSEIAVAVMALPWTRGGTDDEHADRYGDVQTVAARVLATPAAPERDGEMSPWQPIETAPRDGTRILAAGCTLSPRSVIIVSWSSGRYLGKKRGYNQTWVDFPGHECDPKIWMPLLAAPTGAA